MSGPDADGDAGDGAGIPSLADILGALDDEEQEEEREEEGRLHQPLVLHADARGAADGAAAGPVEGLLMQGGADIARAVVFFGPGILVLPMVGRVAGVSTHKCLAYGEHPEGTLQELCTQTLGPIDPQTIMKELQMGKQDVLERAQRLDSEELSAELSLLQGWRKEAGGRLATLERRAAWAVLGISHTADQGTIRRAFKKKALELHPDKGGDADRFQMLQEMKHLLIVPEAGDAGGGGAEGRSAEGKKGRKSRKDARKDGGGDGDEAKEIYEGSDSSSDDAVGADPLGKKGGRKPDDDLDTFSWINRNDRPKLEAARRKIHQDLMGIWDRALRSAMEVKRLSILPSAGGEAARLLRGFVADFASAELDALAPRSPEACERAFRRFLEQGSDVICCAGILDPVATLSEVAMKVNARLIASGASPELEQRCADLLEAIRCLPQTFERFVSPVEKHLEERGREADDEDWCSPEAATSPSGREPAEPPGEAAPGGPTPPGASMAAGMEIVLGEGEKEFDAASRERGPGAQLQAHDPTALCQAVGARPVEHGPRCRCMRCIKRRQGWQGAGQAKGRIFTP